MIIDSQNSVVLKQLRNSSKINKNALIKDSVKKHEKLILDLNRKQLRSGLKSDGNYIAPDYSPAYLDFKLSLSSYKAPGGVPDLYLSGELQNNMILDIANVQYLIYSTVRYSEKLEQFYGENIFGLLRAHLEQVRGVVTPDFNKKYHLQLNK